jgi:hypothetical protein
MSAAAILSVAARKAASEGKKVGAAALTLIALVVLSISAFPGLNRAPSDQMAEAPANAGSSDSSGQSSTSNQDAGSAPAISSPDEASALGDSSTNPNSGAAGSSGSSAQSPTPGPSDKEIEKVLADGALGGVMNSDSRSKIFVLDEEYTAVGDNGLSAKFIFNPASESPFNSVRAEIKLEELLFTFVPTNSGVLSGKTNDGHDLFIFSGQAPYLFDSNGKKWSETATTNARFTIQVIMQKNGVDVKEITLSLNSAN